jgi:predicted enzyme related to lactoylglutathione lyase
MAHPVVHFEILTKDPDALSSFYKQAFDWDISESESGGASADGGSIKYLLARPYGNVEPERGINGGIGAVPDDYGGHVTFYVHVDDVSAALNNIERLGGTTMMPPQQLPGMVIALFKDPQGHTVGLVNSQM